MNSNFDEDIEESLDKGYKRLAIVTTIWCIITTPIIFFIPESYLVIFAFFWLIWSLIGIKLSPWITKKISKYYE